MYPFFVFSPLRTFSSLKRTFIRLLTTLTPLRGITKLRMRKIHLQCIFTKLEELRTLRCFLLIVLDTLFDPHL